MEARDLPYRVLRRALSPLGLEVVRDRDAAKRNKRIWLERLKLAAKLGFAPRRILDGGAFRGLWSRVVAGLFPGAQIVLVEPNPHVLEAIAENTSHIAPAPIILNVALGESQKTASLNIWREADADQGASLLDHVSGPAREVVQVQVDTLDNIARRLSFLPDLLKLDLQGGELAALKGGRQVLQNAELAIMEFGCLDAYVNRTTPRELVDIMYDNDYCLYDIASCGDRPHDGALTGGDFFFVKNRSILRSHKGWE